MNRKHRMLPLAALSLVLALLAGLIGPVPVQAQTVPTEPAPTVEAATPLQADAPGAVRSRVTIPAKQDAYIAFGYPNSNFGAASSLYLGWDANGPLAVRMLMQWDLGSIPKNAVIKDAFFQIYQSQVVPPGDSPMGFEAQYMRQSWNEYGVTWNNANYLGGQPLPLGSIPGTVDWQTANATNLVKTWVSGAQPNYGLIVTGNEIQSQGKYRVFASRETGSGPQLVVDYTVNCDTVPPTAQVAALKQFEPGEFVVSWSGQDFAPSGCQPSGIANYDVQYSINNGSWKTWKQGTISISNTFKGNADNGDFVQFRARATDHAGNIGAYTNAQASTTVDTVPPVANMIALLPFQTFSSFTVSWTGTDNLSGIANYDVEYQVDGGEWQMLVQGTTAINYTITGAQTGNSYAFRVRATDRVGNVQSWPDAAQTETVVLTYPLVGLSPIEPSVITSTTLPVTDTITLNWEGFTAPGTTITQYQVYYTFGTQSRIAWKTFDAPVLTANFPWLSMGLGDGVYTFDVTATNSLGQTTDLNSKYAYYGREGVIVDMAGNVVPQIYMPVIADSAP